MSSGLANNKAQAQPAHLRSLISAFVIRLLESIISELATNKMSIFSLASVAEQDGLGLIWLETPNTDFALIRMIKHTRGL